MKIVIDTKEQAPWRFDSVHTIIRRSLDTGDYSIESYESLITVERKSLDDLVRTVIHDWQRFSRQLRRMAAMDYGVIVVDSTIQAVEEKKYSGETHPNSVMGKVNAIYLEFGVPTFWMGDRTTSAKWVENLFKLYLEKR